MPRASKPKKNLILADGLEAWALKYGNLDDAYVSGLLAGLRQNKNLEVWASLNPLEYLPIPAVKAGAKLQARTRLVLVVRNVLVFAPVALTWIAVGEATTGFAEYAKENTATVVNFLDFWQNGYDILPEEYRIATVARLDALIIFGVIVLTLLASVSGKRAVDKTNQAENLADRERMVIAVEIASFLHTKRAISTVTMNQALIGALSKLLNATESLESTTKILEKATKEAKSIKPVKIEKNLKVENSFSSFDLGQFDMNQPKKKIMKWPRREGS
jgi:hypothetical protein